MQAVNATNIAKMAGNGNLEENGLYALLISRQEEIIGLVKPLLPKSTMKPRVIHITIIPLVSLQITCVYCSTFGGIDCNHNVVEYIYDTIQLTYRLTKEN